MRSVEVVVKVPGPRLPIVMREIVDRLCSDDWERRSTEDGEQFYYVIGEAASRSEANFKVSEFPAAKATAQPKQPGVLAEWYVRSQVAGGHPDYLQRAKTRLEGRGVRASVLDRFLTGEKNIEEFFAGEFTPDDEGLTALTEFLQAWQIFKSEGQPPSLDEEDAQEVDTAREKLYLQELSQKFQSMVDRGGPLEVLSLSDRQLEEASKCYLYGFFRAAVVLGAAALETHLKLSTAKDRFSTYDELVDAAWWSGKLSKDPKDFADPAKIVFKKRNDVVHKKWVPKEDDTGEILGITRKVVDYLRSPNR